MKKAFAAALIFSVLITLGNIHAFAADQKEITKTPVIKFINNVLPEYSTGDRISLSVSAPNYSARVEYRAILLNVSTKKTTDLWSTNNGYPDNYYKKAQPNGKSKFTIGYAIREPGTYKFTVYVRRVGLDKNLYADKNMNCDSYITTRAFVINPRQQVDVNYLGVLLSDGTRIEASNSGNNEYFIDLSSLKSGTGVKVLIKVSQNSQLTIIDERLKNSDTKFTLKANEERSFGPSDLKLPDNDPPGVSIDTLRYTYSDTAGFITGKARIASGSSSKEIILKIKVK